VIIADTSGLLAFFNKAEPLHDEVRRMIEIDDEALVVSPYVVAELDYLIATRIGVKEELTVLSELASGGYLLAALDETDLEQAVAVITKYQDQEIGVADASIVVLADRFQTRTILTLDRRHFEVLRPLSGGKFKVIP